MVFDEYLNQPVDLDWYTEDFDLATRIVRKLEERKIPYNLKKNRDKWSFTISTINGNAVDVIEMIKVG